MAQRDEEMKKRQAKRAAMEARRKAQQKRMKRMLILAAVVLALCAGGLVYLISNAEPGSESVAVQPQKPVETKPPETKPVAMAFQDPKTVIHIKAAGDLNVTDKVIDAGLAISGYDFSRAFQDVAAILADADLTVMNFEGNIYGEPYGSQTGSAPHQLLKDLRSCGVDLVQMANSCAVNNGLNGLYSTLQAIRTAGIEPIGAYSSQAEFNTAKAQHNGS